MPLGRDNCSFATTRAHREAETLLQTLRDPTSGPRQEAQQADRLVYVVVEQNELLRLAQEVWIHQGHDATVEALDRIWGTRRDPEKRAPRVATDLRAALTEAARHDQAPPEERQRGGARTEMLWERLVRTRRRRNERSGSWVSRGLSTLRQPIPGAIRWLVERRRGWLTAAEGLSRLATLAVPALVYVLTLYTDTWGSELDVVSALAVGFGGKLAIDLGASGLRARAADDEPSHGGGDDAGVGRSRSPQSPGVGSSN
jgi:hypothetical protein